MKSEKIKNIVIGIVATATIVGGLVVLFDPNKPMSYEEYQILIQVYNYEIEKAGGEITLTDVKGNMIEVLNKYGRSDDMVEVKRSDLDKLSLLKTGTVVYLYDKNNKEAK